MSYIVSSVISIACVIGMGYVGSAFLYYICACKPTNKNLYVYNKEEYDYLRQHFANTKKNTLMPPPDYASISASEAAGGASETAPIISQPNKI